MPGACRLRRRVVAQFVDTSQRHERKGPATSFLIYVDHSLETSKNRWLSCLLIGRNWSNLKTLNLETAGDREQSHRFRSIYHSQRRSSGPDVPIPRRLPAAVYLWSCPNGLHICVSLFPVLGEELVVFGVGLVYRLKHLFRIRLTTSRCCRSRGVG